LAGAARDDGGKHRNAIPSHGLPCAFIVTPLVVTTTETGAVFVPSVKLIVQVPALIGVTVAVYGDVDCIGLMLATPLHVSPSVNMPA